jgi:hypothetical protein
MKPLSTELKETIARRLELASAAEILAIASQLCGANYSPVNPVASVSANSWTNFESIGGVAPPTQRLDFSLSYCGIVKDRSTGLMWDREDIGSGLNWKDAHKACADLRLGGFADWRLPTLRELLTLVDYERHSPAIDKDAFPTCKSTSWYWTSTPLASSPDGYAWAVSFDNGHVARYRQNNETLVRAVRNV